MHPTPSPAQAPAPHGVPLSRAIPKHEIVVLDAATAESIGTQRPPGRPDELSDAELFKAEHAMPDGSAAMPHERQYIPWMIAGLAIAGLVIVGLGMFAVGGLSAAIVGLVWVLMGYAVAWSVVWMAGLIRVKEEHEIEEALHVLHGHLPSRKS
jgi:hypothetical protein